MADQAQTYNGYCVKCKEKRDFEGNVEVSQDRHEHGQGQVPGLRDDSQPHPRQGQGLTRYGSPGEGAAGGHPSPCRVRAAAAACRLPTSATGRLWTTRQFLWTTPDRARAPVDNDRTRQRGHGHDSCHDRTTALAPPAPCCPASTRLWRDRHTLQLGARPRPAVLLEVADPRAARLLDLLDGTRSERAVLDARGAGAASTADDARTLLDTLRAAGLVVAAAHACSRRDLTGPVRARLAGEADALALAAARTPRAHPPQVLRRRRAARVLVTGAGRLGGADRASRWPRPASVTSIPTWTAGSEPADLVGTGLTAADVGRTAAAAVRRAARPDRPGHRDRRRSGAAGPTWWSRSAPTGRPRCSPPDTPSAASRTCWSACATAYRWSARWSGRRSAPA